MLELWLWCGAIAIVLGVVLGLVVHYGKLPVRIPWWEYTVCGLVLVVALGALTSWVGYNMAMSHQTTYNEFWGGYELKTVKSVDMCTEDGSCVYTYQCDPYLYTYTVTVSDGNGKSHTETRTEIRYHSCPYSTEEDSYYIETTLGEYTIASHWFPANPQQWRGGSGLPGGVPRGQPQFWVQAQQRIASGKPGPVTAERTYKNYILASQSTLLAAHSADIAQYQKAGLLPDINHSIADPYFLDRAYFEGVKIADKAAWEHQLNVFDAALGEVSQGDLYVVVVDANRVPASISESYLLALTAYWESPHFDKNDISKNGIIVVLGTKDGKTVDWAKASTGMPSGNENMLGDIESQLPGKALDPTTLFGNPNIVFPPAQVKGKYQFQLSPGANPGVLENIILTGPDKFVRQQMGTYSYLSGDIKPTGGETAIILSVFFVLALAGWAGLAFWGAQAINSARTGSRRDSWYS